MNLVFVIVHNGIKRIERLAYQGQPLIVGRGWQSDVIVDDKCVDEDHLQIDLDTDGNIAAADLQSLNGVFLNRRRLFNRKARVAENDTLRLGDTEIRIYLGATSVGAAAPRSSWFTLLDRFESVFALGLLTLLAVSSDVLVSWLSDSELRQWSDFFASIFTALLGIAGISFLLALSGKLLRNEFNLRAHWLLVCLAIIAFALLSLVVDVVRFNLQAPGLGDTLTTISFAALAILFMSGALSYLTFLTPIRRAACATALVLIGLVITYQDQWLLEEHERWSAYSDLEDTTLPAHFLFSNTVSLEQHFSEVDALFDSHSAAAEPVEPDEVKWLCAKNLAS